MTVLTITPANISATFDRLAAQTTANVAGVALTVGQAVYLDASNLLQKAIATASATSQAIGIVVGVPQGNIYGETVCVAGDQVDVCTAGPVYGFSGLVSGQTIWVDKTTAGSLNDTAPTTAYQYAVGHAVGDDTLFIAPGTTSPVSA